MIIGYARVSTRGQQAHGNSFDEQRQTLIVNGCQEVLEEQFTGRTTDRPVLNNLLLRLNSGDTLMVTKLDRLARNVSEGIELVRNLFNRGIRVHVLNIGLLENTAMGNFFLATLLAVAELERSMIVERTQSGKEIAKTRKGFKEGRPPTPEVKIKHALSLLKEYSYKEVVEMTGISKSTLVRWKRKDGSYVG